ncbi:Patatin OS=Afipia felis OX=1035 GN=BN961_01153 PE=4 SV=1 [Afipia felis]
MARVRAVLGSLSACALLIGCATIQNDPVNLPGTPPNLANSLGPAFEESTSADETIIGLSFSGGGTRAAAYAFGVLSEMERIPMRGARGPMIDRVEFISGVSGGSVTAAYYGLKKKAGLADFREKFLLRNAEEDLQTNLSLATLGRAFAGGINDSTGFPRWLDANLFHGATFGEFRAIGKPRVWINASDIYNRTPFVFGAVTFNAICSDLSQYPLSSAVAASAAVPVAFAPVVIQSFPTKCDQPLPAWVERVRRDQNASPLLSSFATALTKYHDGAVPFIKLLDGGLVDNFGLSGFTIARLSSDTPYGPLSPRQAVKLRRALFLVADASAPGPSPNWINTIEGPRGADLVRATADTALGASVATSFTAFNSTMNDWQAALIRWRCGLSVADRARYGAGPNWNCRDVRFFVGRIGFNQLDPERTARLNNVPTRFHLPQQQVDDVIEAGRDTLRGSPVFKAFASSL